MMKVTKITKEADVLNSKGVFAQYAFKNKNIDEILELERLAFQITVIEKFSKYISEGK
jgi:hypothetical protein